MKGIWFGEITEAQFAFLEKLAKRTLVGPSPEYQGDLVHLSGPELNRLIDSKLIGRMKLPQPREGEEHRDKPPYLKITHRYFIRKGGRNALSTLAQHDNGGPQR
jgi:hypothetical protein